jgi:hypothetical protein
MAETTADVRRDIELVTGLHEAFDSRIKALVDDLKTAISAPTRRAD